MLDKTLTPSMRQVWRWTRYGLYAAVPIYLVLVFLNAWGLKTGGISLNRSPFKDRVPEQYGKLSKRYQNRKTDTETGSSTWGRQCACRRVDARGHGTGKYKFFPLSGVSQKKLQFITKRAPSDYSI